MHRKLRSLSVVLAVAALAFGARAGAQGPAREVAFDGFAFSLPEEIASSVNVTVVPGDATDVFGPVLPATRFSLYGPSQVPRAGGSLGELWVPAPGAIATAEFELGQVEALRELLEARPDLGAVEGSLPLVPEIGAAQGIVARARYVDTPEVSGIAWITAFRQDIFPFAAADFTAVFLGTNADGTQVVTVLIPVRTDRFPETVTDEQVMRVQSERAWQRYVARSARTLAAAEPADFSPSLTSIEALISSISFDDAPPAPAPSEPPDGG